MNTILRFTMLLFTLGAISMQAQEKSVMLPKDKDVFFKKEYFTGSSYYQFRTNGTYRQINREHMFVKESDQGTWAQQQTGEITLVSAEHYRNIECPPLEVFMWHTQAITRLAPLTVSISNLLAKTSKDTFTSKEIENIERYGYQNVLSRVDVDHGVKTVTRPQLISLTRTISQFLSDPNKNHFHATPMQYKGVTFLLWKDSETPASRNLEDIQRQIAQQKDRSGVPQIYVQIDGQTFEKESGKTQQFIFHPELNNRIPHTQAK